MNKMASKEYRTALAAATKHHANSKTYSGRFLRPHKPWLTDLIKRLDINSALDYGCGKGEQYRWVDPADGQTLEQTWGFEVEKFDPAWPPFAAEPRGSYDLVMCTHVLGGIPPGDRPWVIERLYSMANKALFVAEKVGPIKKTVHQAKESLTGLDWVDLLAPQRRDEIETYLYVMYRTPYGKFGGTFRL